MNTSLRGAALVVGGGSGFGLAITVSLLQRGYEVITVGRGKPPEGVRHHYSCDLGDRAEWLITLEKLTAHYSPFGMVGFIAGYARAVDADNVTTEERGQHYRLNSDYVADTYPFLDKLLLPGSTVFTIGSQWLFRKGCPWLIPYMMAKHALCGLTLEMEHLPRAPRSHYFCVPTMPTPSFFEVKQSFVNLGLLDIFLKLGFEQSFSSPSDVSTVLLDHLLNDKGCGRVWHIDSQLQVHPIISLFQ